MSGKYFNGKLSSLPYFFCQVSRVLFQRLEKVTATFIMKGTLASVGSGFKARQLPLVMYPNRITVGTNCQIGKNVTFSSELASGELVIGNDVQINDNVVIDFTGLVVVEDNVTISANTRIFSHDHGREPRSQPEPKKITIGKNVWLGTNSLILQKSGTIGEDAIVGAGCIVSKPVVKGCIVLNGENRTIQS